MTDQHHVNCLSQINEYGPKTPNLDRLAQEGFTFQNAYTASPVCAPARAAIKSGQYPPGCGVISNWIEFREGTELLTDRLSQLGYETALCGKLHFVPHDKDFGFQYKRLNDAPYSTYADDDLYSEYIKWLRQYGDFDKDPVELFNEDEESYATDMYQFSMGSAFRKEDEHDILWVTDASIAFLENRDKEKPFFLFTSYFGPHQPYMPPEPWGNMYDYKEIQLPDNFQAGMDKNPIFKELLEELRGRFGKEYSKDDYKRVMAAYYGQVSMIDAYIGKLMDYMRARELWENTTIIFVSDHGDYMGSYGIFFKGQMYDACCKVPLIIKPENYKGKSIVKSEVVNSLDLYGTVLEIAGDIGWNQEHIESRSLLGLLQNASSDWQNETYSIIGEHKETSLAMIRKDNLKLMVLGRIGKEPLYEMYDLDKDPHEVENIFNHGDYAMDKVLLKNRLDKWWHDQKDKYPKEVISHQKINHI